MHQQQCCQSINYYLLLFGSEFNICEMIQNNIIVYWQMDKEKKLSEMRLMMIEKKKKQRQGQLPLLGNSDANGNLNLNTNTNAHNISISNNETKSMSKNQSEQSNDNNLKQKSVIQQASHGIKISSSQYEAQREKQKQKQQNKPQQKESNQKTKQLGIDLKKVQQKQPKNKPNETQITQNKLQLDRSGAKFLSQSIGNKLSISAPRHSVQIPTNSKVSHLAPLSPSYPQSQKQLKLTRYILKDVDKLKEAIANIDGAFKGIQYIRKRIKYDKQFHMRVKEKLYMIRNYSPEPKDNQLNGHKNGDRVKQKGKQIQASNPEQGQIMVSNNDRNRQINL